MSGLLKSLINPTPAIDEARSGVLEMIHLSQEMFLFVVRALHDEQSEKVKARVKSKDQEVNALQNRVRTVIYRHLTLSHGKDLLPSLQLHDIAGEIERAGDYSKNIAELAEMIPSGVDWGSREQEMGEQRHHVLEMFDLAFRTVESGDRRAADRCNDLYGRVAVYCDRTLEQVVTADDGDDDDDDMVARQHLALVLMLRYNKRVAAHLNNSVTTITNPYKRIGHRP